MKNAISDKEDHVIVHRCIRGDTEAFCVMVKKYQSMLFSLVYHMIGNCDEASTVLEAVFVKAFEELHTYSRRKKFYLWILHVAVMECLDFLHCRDRMTNLKDTGLMSDHDIPDKFFQKAEVDYKLEDALLKLQTGHRIVVVLKHIGKLSYREISEILDLPERTVKSRLYSGRQELRKVILNVKD